jgi:hypothetical protein
VDKVAEVSEDQLDISIEFSGRLELFGPGQAMFNHLLAMSATDIRRMGLTTVLTWHQQIIESRLATGLQVQVIQILWRWNGLSLCNLNHG